MSAIQDHRVCGRHCRNSRRNGSGFGVGRPSRIGRALSSCRTRRSPSRSQSRRSTGAILPTSSLRLPRPILDDLPFDAVATSAHLRGCNLDRGIFVDLRIWNRDHRARWRHVSEKGYDCRNRACHRITSRLTAASPLNASARAPANVRSITRPRTNGPLSVIVTTAERPLCLLVTRTLVPNGNDLCAAVRAPSFNRRPLAVRVPSLVV